MSKGLLIGNGINARLGIDDLSVARIGERFRKNVMVYSIFIQSLFNVEIQEDFFTYLKSQSREMGIETMAGMLYKYVKQNTSKTWTDNDEYRIQDVITCICIASIFYKEEGKISQNYELSKLPQMEEYDYIFSLNYIEFWDRKKQCIYLHGNIDLSKLGNEKNAILVSINRLNLKEYSKVVENIRKTNNVINFKPNDIIFAPEGIKKNNLVCVSGVHPSDKLRPANDLFLYRAKELYVKLSEVNELDIFGMSPYGDESIINEINKKERVRIYIYKKNESEETKVWKEKLTCKYELLDSSEML